MGYIYMDIWDFMVKCEGINEAQDPNGLCHSVYHIVNIL